MNDLIGQTLGPYQILEQLGQGGMATVYKAYHPAMDRYVAIKVLPRHMASDPQFRARFLREARTIAKLEQRYILPVHDTGEQDGIHYMVMRYTDGGTLSELIAAGKLSVERVTTLVAQVADALGYAHHQGVVHRDIKPANILISREGDALLSDFGIARIVEGTMQLTSDGMLIGTPYYMAPEQVQGQPSDARSDIYALGVVLYEALTGRRPYEAETPLAVALMHVHNPLPPPRQLRPNLPEALERVILRAMAKNPTDRFQNADEMAAALRATLNSSQVTPAPVSIPSATLVLPNDSTTVGLPAAPVQPPKTAKPRPRWLIPAIVGVLVVLGLGVGSRFIRQEQGNARTPRLDGTRIAIEPTAPTDAAAEPAPGNAAENPSDGVGSLPYDLTFFTNTANTSSLVTIEDRVWAATNGGLITVEGENRKVYTAANDALPFTAIRTLLAESDTMLWAAGEYDIARLEIDGEDINAATIYTVDEMGLDYIRAFARLSDGSMVAGGYIRAGLIRWDGSAWARYGPDLNAEGVDIDGDITALAQTDDGTLYIAGYEGLLRWDGTTLERYSEEQGIGLLGIRQVLIDSEQGVWAVAGDAGLLRLNPEENRWERVALLDEQPILGLVQFRDGRLGAASYEQLAESNDGGTTWRTLPDTSTEFGIQPQAIAEAADGTIWLGSAQGLGAFRDGNWTRVQPEGEITDNAVGQLVAQDDLLFVVPRYGGQVAQIDQDDNLILVEDVYARAVAFAAESIWYGDNDGLFRRQGDTITQLTTANGLPDNQILAMLATDATLWVGTQNGLVSLDFASGTLNTPVPEFAGAAVEVLYAAPDGSIWAGTINPDGANRPALIGHLEGESWQTWQAGAAPFSEGVTDVAAFATDADGVLWVSMWNGGLWRLQGGSWAQVPMEEATPPGNVLAMTLYDGAIVAVGQLGAIHVWQAGKWQQIDLIGVPSQVNSIFYANDGALWLGTTEGLARYK